MAQTPPREHPEPATLASRPCLRLVKEDEAAPTAPSAVAAAGPKSRIAQFLTAYADAIDRDIQAILDL